MPAGQYPAGRPHGPRGRSADAEEVRDDDDERNYEKDRERWIDLRPVAERICEQGGRTRRRQARCSELDVRLAWRSSARSR